MFSLTNTNPDTKLLDEKTKEIEESAAVIQEKEKVILEKDEKIAQEKKKAEQVIFFLKGEAVVTLFKTRTKSQRNSTKKKSYSTKIWYFSCFKEV